jgi:hypothetical protein
MMPVWRWGCAIAGTPAFRLPPSKESLKLRRQCNIKFNCFLLYVFGGICASLRLFSLQGCFYKGGQALM